MPELLAELIRRGWIPVAPYLVRYPVQDGSASMLVREGGSATLLFHAAGSEWLIEFGPGVPDEIVLSAADAARRT